MDDAQWEYWFDKLVLQFRYEGKSDKRAATLAQRELEQHPEDYPSPTCWDVQNHPFNKGH